MKWTVLGFQSPYPGEGGATPGYLLEVSGQRILIDCGSGVLAQLGRIMKPHELDAVWLSHLHHDHIADFLVLQYAVQTAIRLGKRNRPLTVLAPDRPERWSRMLPYRNAIDLHPIRDEGRWTFAGGEVAFHRTEHAVPCYAMEIRSHGITLLYGADAGPGTRWERMVEGPDLFVCEGSYLHRDTPENPVGHHSVRQAAEAAETIGAKRLLLTHLFPEYPREALAREAEDHYSGELILADIGITVDLDG